MWWFNKKLLIVIIQSKNILKEEVYKEPWA